MVRKAKDPEVRKKEIIDAAEELFAERGYDSTSVDDIAKMVGVSHGLFYHYFDSKASVVDAIVVRLADEVGENIRKIADAPDLTALEKFRRMMLESLESKKSKKYLIKLFQGEEKTLLLSRYMDATISEMSMQISKIVEQGVDEGVFRTPCPRLSVDFWLHGRFFMVQKYMSDPLEILEYLKAETRFIELLLEADDGALKSLWKDYFKEMSDFLPTEVN